MGKICEINSCVCEVENLINGVEVFKNILLKRFFWNERIYKLKRKLNYREIW